MCLALSIFNSPNPKPQSAIKPPQTMSFITIGNTAVPIVGKQDSYRWTVFVRDAPEPCIQSVTFRLHPTFTPNVISVVAPAPLTLTRTVREFGHTNLALVIRHHCESASASHTTFSPLPSPPYFFSRWCCLGLGHL